MRNLSRAMQSLLIGGTLAVLLFVAAPFAAHAQTPASNAAQPISTAQVTQADMAILLCQNNPNCLSFDPKVNPFLSTKGYTVNEPNSPGGAPKQTADGQCVVYNVPGPLGNSIGGTIATGCVKNGVFTLNGTVIGGGGATGESTTGAATTDSTGAAGYTPTTAGPGAGACDIKNPATWGDCFLNVIARFVLGLSNFMLGVAGVLLNWVVVKTVFQFSTLIGNSAGLLTAWSILRDIGNLVLLFGFVLMGIGTILDTSKLPDKKAIPMLIIFAILLNFSIFAAEAVIDTSNVLTSVLYSQANTDPCTTETCTINNGIAGHIMQSTGLSSIYGLKPDEAGEGVKKFVVLIGLSLFSLIGTVVLFAAALMLAFRAIILTGLIIVSPIGFAGMAIKPLEKMAKRWWNALIHQAFFAPILFLLLFVTLKVTEGFSSVSNNNNLANALTGAGTSNMGIIMVFVLICGGLIASLVAAKQFGAMGADIAIKTAGGFAFGTGAFVGRRTLGAGSAAVSRNIKSSKFGASVMGKAFAGIADKGAAASFDARTFAPKKIGKLALPDLGKPGKTAAGGYATIEKKGIDDRTKYAAGLTLSPEAKKEDDRLKAEKKNVAAVFKDEKKIKDDEKKAELAGLATSNQAFTAQINNLQRIVANPDAERTRIQQQIDVEARRQGELLSAGKTAESLQLNAPIAVLRQQLADVGQASAALEHLKAEQAAEQERSRGRREAITSAQAAMAKHEDAALKKLDTAIIMNSPKGVYADRLEKSVLNKLPIGVAQANKKAAEKIKAEFKKTKLDNAFSGLEKAFKDSKDGTVSTAEVIEAVKEAEEEKDNDEK